VSSRSQSAQLDLRKQFASFGNCYFCTKVFKIRFMIGKFPTKQNFKTGFPQFKFRAMVLEKFCEILSRPNYVTLLFVWCQFPKVLVFIKEFEYANHFPVPSCVSADQTLESGRTWLEPHYRIFLPWAEISSYNGSIALL
jgi:hypothetical protein